MIKVCKTCGYFGRITQNTGGAVALASIIKQTLPV